MNTDFFYLTANGFCVLFSHRGHGDILIFNRQWTRMDANKKVGNWDGAFESSNLMIGVGVEKE